MRLFKHRANKISDPLKYKYLELDLRYRSFLVVGHELNGFCLFKDYLKNCTEEHELAINIKEAGIIDEIIKEMEHSRVKNWFIFDMAVPDFVYAMNKIPEHTAMRISEYENKKFNIDYVWLDLFTDYENINKYMRGLKDKKIVVVSPELHGSEFKYEADKRFYGYCTDLV